VSWTSIICVPQRTELSVQFPYHQDSIVISWSSIKIHFIFWGWFYTCQMIQWGHNDPSILMKAIDWILSIKFACSFSSSIFQAASWAYIDSQYSKTLHKKAQKNLPFKTLHLALKTHAQKHWKVLVLCASLKEKMFKETSNAIKFKVHTMQISCQVLHVGWHPRSRHQPKVGMPLGNATPQGHSYS